MIVYVSTRVVARCRRCGLVRDGSDFSAARAEFRYHERPSGNDPILSTCVAATSEVDCSAFIDSVPQLPVDDDERARDLARRLVDGNAVLASLREMRRSKSA